MPGKCPVPLHGLTGHQQRVHPVHHIGAAGSERQPAGTVLWVEALLLCCHGLGRLGGPLGDAFRSPDASRLTSLLGGSVVVLLAFDLVVKAA